jgi:hypothetical protein
MTRKLSIDNCAFFVRHFIEKESLYLIGKAKELEGNFMKTLYGDLPLQKTGEIIVGYDLPH